MCSLIGAALVVCDLEQLFFRQNDFVPPVSGVELAVFALLVCLLWWLNLQGASPLFLTPTMNHSLPPHILEVVTIVNMDVLQLVVEHYALTRSVDITFIVNFLGCCLDQGLEGSHLHLAMEH